MTKDLFIDRNYRSGPSPSTCLHVRPNNELGDSITDLSPTARAVLDAYETTYTETGLVAAIRALADQVVPHSGRYPMNEYMLGIRDAKQDVRATILAIADELES